MINAFLTRCTATYVAHVRLVLTLFLPLQELLALSRVSSTIPMSHLFRWTFVVILIPRLLTGFRQWLPAVTWSRSSHGTITSGATLAVLLTSPILSLKRAGKIEGSSLLGDPFLMWGKKHE